MAVTMEMVKELRAKTGAGVLDCKKALQQSDGDMQQAVDFLRKKGLAAAAKKSGRATTEGLVCIVDSAEKGQITMLSLLCETDFVARTDEFKALANEMVQVFDQEVPPSAGEAVGPEMVEKYTPKLTEEIARIGENIQLGDYCKLVRKENGHFFHYIHHTGKIGVVLEMVSEADVSELAELGKNLCLHIAAFSPEFVDRDRVPGETIEKEKEIYRDQMKESGKPENVVEKIIEGKVSKFFEERCLMEQKYALDQGQNTTISQMVKETEKNTGKPLHLSHFCRIEIS
ncbi:MAG TPA: translation elongation factor Ts [Thermotogota bacterium]|nr:translation elongation factor Ts [Thermotogota bacterium]HRW92670.1 translation elongation factor Ts [Thermotogota bacterium]